MKVKGWIEDGQIKCMSQICSFDCPRCYECKEYEIEVKEIDCNESGRSTQEII